ncbi:MAG TPA: TRAP transporter substrate-binding protein [Paenalcaligenes hominis]|uniref:TRAP transporter substrate-binding protein n=1 Tax=Paenalcaligenes hominis TaxID=643674 RepID=A0A9D2VFU7_9BURK|nr:TRAP transporter substrate-binding protein [Paenalcaligenes hominis]NJB65147.1 tripartite ATP-independent transporter DctP family solute receptor [Paenalcaligenes hominis]GGE56230.1 C4-dicarboxylate ABC transporter [Paenalcaligenes hominis]HJH23709.1 TRAP transporter substrate-binding protein [Paenalcaligenes hominis]
MELKKRSKGLSGYSGVRQLCSALVVAAGLAVTQGAVNAKTLRSADVHPNNYPTVESVNYMSERLKEMTNGDLDIKVFGSGQLGNEKATLEQTRFGVLDMNRITLGEINNLVEDTVVLSLPYVFRSKEHMRKVVDSEIGAEMLASLEPHGLIGLAFFDAGSRNIYNSKHEVKTPSDLAGLKIRVQPSDIFLDMINTLGANAVPMGFNEMYSGLQTGVIDGTEQSWPTYESTNHVEVAKYYSLTEHLMLPEALVMSKITYDKLTEEQKKAVHLAAQDAKYKMRDLWDAREKESERIVREKGAVITEVDKQLFMDKVAPVQEKYLKNERLKTLFDRIQAVE